MAMIEAQRLTKKYDDVVAVDEVTFTVNEAEIFGFLGPNGAGKTTTINMLTTLIPPTSGKASIAGFDIVKEQIKVKHNIGVVPQDLTSDGELTGMKNLLLQAAMYGMPKEVAKTRASELLDLVGLSEVAQKRVWTYSGGMMKRLEFAAGIIHRPKVLFLDEPTLGLDVRTRRIVWDYVLKLRRETGLTVLLTTHYMEEAEQYCDRVAIIHQGRVRTIGAPSKLKESVAGGVVEVVIPDKSNQAFDILNTLNGILDVKNRGTSFLVTVSDGDEGLANINGAFEKAGLKPERISLIRPSLEGAFLKLTEETMTEAMESSFDRLRFGRNIKRLNS
jgi:ABC-2 type transport system ATP-binding protein